MSTQSQKPVVTNQDKLKTQVLSIARELFRVYREDRELAIKNGAYTDDESNSINEYIKHVETTLDEFEKSKPCVYVYVSGGNVQGASGTCDIDFDLYDKDNYDVGEGDELTPDEWNEMIEKLTENGEIKGIY